MGQENNDNPGMAEREMDETPMEGREGMEGEGGGMEGGPMRSGAEGDQSLQDQENRTGGYGYDTPEELNRTSDGMSANDRMGEIGRSTMKRDTPASEGLSNTNRDW